MDPVISEKSMFLKNNTDSSLRRTLTTISDQDWLVLLLFAGGALFAAVQSLLLDHFFNPGALPEKMSYGNYVIFRQSFYHLLHGQDIYGTFPETPDFFKYSPAFALLFGTIAWLPDVIGLPLWSLINAFTLFFAIKALPGFSPRRKNLILLFIIVELITTLQNSQSNALIAGLIIYGFVLLEKRKYLPATLLLVFSVYIKLFGIVALALFLFYPDKLRLILYSLLWAFVFLILPIPFTGTGQTIFLYQSWAGILSRDFSSSMGFSIMGWLTSWFSLEIPKLPVMVAGFIATSLPLLLLKKYKDLHFRLLMMASLLIWVVIFNHKAESPTFILAMTGVAIWLFSGKITPFHLFLAIFALLLTSLSVTELLQPLFGTLPETLALKAFPCILIWLKILWDQLTFQSKNMA